MREPEGDHQPQLGSESRLRGEFEGPSASPQLATELRAERLQARPPATLERAALLPLRRYLDEGEDPSLLKAQLGCVCARGASSRKPRARRQDLRVLVRFQPNRPIGPVQTVEVDL
jgi:hypothetical protein